MFSLRSSGEKCLQTARAVTSVSQREPRWLYAVCWHTRRPMGTLGLEAGLGGPEMIIT